MAEVFTIDECTIKRVGSAAGDSTEATISSFAEGVNVSVTRNFGERFDTEGVRQRRVPLWTEAVMTINKLYDATPFLFDGNDVKVYLANSIGGTETWTFSKAYWRNKGYAFESTARLNVEVVGNNYTQA